MNELTRNQTISSSAVVYKKKILSWLKFRGPTIIQQPRPRRMIIGVSGLIWYNNHRDGERTRETERKSDNEKLTLTNRDRVFFIFSYSNRPEIFTRFLVEGLHRNSVMYFLLVANVTYKTHADKNISDILYNSIYEGEP